MNNFCGYCLPTNTSLISHQIPQRQQQEVLITGGKRAGLKSLFVCEKELSDCVKLNQSLRNSENLQFTHSKGTFDKPIMVSIIYVFYSKTSWKFEKKNVLFSWK